MGRHQQRAWHRDQSIHIADEVLVDGKIDVTIYQPLARRIYGLCPNYHAV